MKVVVASERNAAEKEETKSVKVQGFRRRVWGFRVRPPFGTRHSCTGGTVYMCEASLGT